ncbi:hypothetical protein BRADI_4g23193v3 [Brachypodium distachyon]|uniref:Uncharacterized protein n=1 Tax=Brachypodium distachyon TaxID=15368 RepID=A0A0Q3L915_BRADI|nr:hypothetical protein BRADI_4g23193v3 [Brachypodium distachyon]
MPRSASPPHPRPPTILLTTGDASTSLTRPQRRPDEQQELLPKRRRAPPYLRRRSNSSNSGHLPPPTALDAPHATCPLLDAHRVPSIRPNLVLPASPDAAPASAPTSAATVCPKLASSPPRGAASSLRRPEEKHLGHDVATLPEAPPSWSNARPLLVEVEDEKWYNDTWGRYKLVIWVSSF